MTASGVVALYRCTDLSQGPGAHRLPALLRLPCKFSTPMELPRPSNSPRPQGLPVTPRTPHTTHGKSDGSHRGCLTGHIIAAASRGAKTQVQKVITGS